MAARSTYNPAQNSKLMIYVKGSLSALMAIILAELLPGMWSAFRGISQTKATGVAAIAGGLVESAFSPLHWILATLIFAALFAASRLGNKTLRVILFWIPTVTVCSITLAIAGLVASLIILLSRTS